MTGVREEIEMLLIVDSKAQGNGKHGSAVKVTSEYRPASDRSEWDGGARPEFESATLSIGENESAMCETSAD